MSLASSIKLGSGHVVQSMTAEEREQLVAGLLEGTHSHAKPRDHVSTHPETPESGTTTQRPRASFDVPSLLREPHLDAGHTQCPSIADSTSVLGLSGLPLSGIGYGGTSLWGMNGMCSKLDPAMCPSL